GADTVSVIVEEPTAPGVTVKVRAAPVPLRLMPAAGATLVFELVAVTVSWLGAKGEAATARDRLGLFGSPSAAGRPLWAGVIVGGVGGGVVVLPDPITVPGAKATPR